MNLTLTNNFYCFAAQLLFGNNTALGTTATNTELSGSAPLFSKIKKTDGTEISAIGMYATQNYSMGAVANAKNPSTSKLFFDIGSGTAAATKTDYSLTALSDTSYTISTEIKRYVDDGAPKVKYSVTITAVSADITFTEIGMLKNLMTTGGMAYEKTLLGRVVIPSTTITAGNSKVFDIDIDIPIGA